MKRINLHMHRLKKREPVVKALCVVSFCMSTMCMFSLHAMERELFVYYPKNNLTVIQTPCKDYGLPGLDEEFMFHDALKREGNIIKIQGRLRINDGNVAYDNTCTDEDDAFEAGEQCVTHIIAQLHKELGNSFDKIIHCTAIEIYYDDELDINIQKKAKKGVLKTLKNVFGKKIFTEKTKFIQTLSSTWPENEALVWVDVEFEIKADAEEKTS